MLKLPLFLLLLMAFTGKNETLPPSQQTDLQRAGYQGAVKTVTFTEYTTNKWGDYDTERILQEYSKDGNMIHSVHYTKHFTITKKTQHRENTRYSYTKREGSFPSYNLSVDSFTGPYSSLSFSYKLDSNGNITEQSQKSKIIYFKSGDTASITHSHDGQFTLIETGRLSDKTRLYLKSGDSTQVTFHVIVQQRDSLGNITKALKYDNIDNDLKKTVSYRQYEFY